MRFRLSETGTVAKREPMPKREPKPFTRKAVAVVAEDLLAGGMADPDELAAKHGQPWQDFDGAVNYLLDRGAVTEPWLGKFAVPDVGRLKEVAGLE